MAVVGFELPPPERLEPKSSALDRSATLPFLNEEMHLIEKNKYELDSNQNYINQIRPSASDKKSRVQILQQLATHPKAH